MMYYAINERHLITGQTKWHPKPVRYLNGCGYQKSDSACTIIDLTSVSRKSVHWSWYDHISDEIWYLLDPLIKVFMISWVVG